MVLWCVEYRMSEKNIFELAAIVSPARVSAETEDRQQHAHDASSHDYSLPDIVVWPQNTHHVCAVLKYSYEHAIPLTVFGAGTSLEGNPIPLCGGIVLDMRRMDRVLSVYSDDFQAVVEPGIIGDELNRQLAVYGLFFPAFPASSHIATIGGMIANNAGGMYAVKYGVVGDWVMALEIVLANGTVITTGSRSIKSVAGYNLKELFIGSEGTLGIITKITLKVLPAVAHKVLMLVGFPTVDQALGATLSILRANIQPAALEFLDQRSVEYVNTLRSGGWKESPTVIVELHGIRETMIQEAETIHSVCKTAGCDSFVLADTEKDIRRIWDGRKSVYPSIKAAHPDMAVLPGDIGIPVSQIPAYMKEAEKISKRYGIEIVSFGHIGDGNIHTWVTYRPKDQKSIKQARAMNFELVDLALRLGGTCTAEHGVGIGKKAYLKKEHADSIAIMQHIKHLLDPKNILNPGKVI